MSEKPATEALGNSIEPIDDQPRWSSLGLPVYLKIIMLAAAFLWFFYQDITGIVQRWINDASWSHGFLIPLFSLYFLQQKKKQILNLRLRPSYILGLGCLLFFLAMYPLNVVQFKFGYGRSILMLCVLAAMVLFLGGWALFRYSWLPVGFLFFAIPMPDRLYSQMTIPMRKLAAQVSAIVLNWVPNIEASVQGVIIDVFYQGRRLEPGLDVAEACSGMRLLMAFVALGVAMAYLHERPVWQRLVLLASTIPIAILCNVVRVTITGFIYVLWDPQYAQGIYHDLLGMLMLPLSFALYGLLAWLMGNLFVEEETIQPDVVVRKSLTFEGDDLK